MPEQKPGRSRQDYATPPELLNAVKLRLKISSFSIDLAAFGNNTAAIRWIDEQQNSLNRQWNYPTWMWLNPPFGETELWVMKAYLQTNLHKSQLAMLVPAAVGSNWWKDWVHNKCQVLFLNGRITFVGETNCYPKDCCILLYGPNVEKGKYECWTWKNEK